MAGLGGSGIEDGNGSDNSSWCQCLAGGLLTGWCARWLVKPFTGNGTHCNVSVRAYLDSADDSISQNSL